MRMVACDRRNYRVGRRSPISYIVIHYTANDGDTAYGNAQYFARTPLASSAHYFVDEKEVVQSVAEADTAWHCGGTSYRHGDCRNDNSIGVELCSRRDAKGDYYFKPETLDNAVQLVRELMDTYQIAADHVLRHYDVTGKNCPAPFVKDRKAWQKFRKGLEEAEMTYAQFEAFMEQYLNELAHKEPAAWSEESRGWAEQNGVIQGDSSGNKRYRSFVTREELAAVLHRTRQGNC